jgi:hypothetical protein
MLTTSKEANPNYLAKVVALKGLKKHSNADRLQTVDIDFQTVITGLDAKEGDVYVFFPAESKISAEFLSHTNSFRKNLNLNTDLNAEGFFEANCRVRAMRLRGEKSMGYIVPSFHVSAWAGVDILPEDVGISFDTVGSKKLVEKYETKKRESRDARQGKEPKLSRIIDGQVHLHIDTKNLRHNPEAIKPDDVISITYKTHGTSWWVGNVLAKRSLSFVDRIGKFLGLSINETEYDLIYGSRRVVKNKAMKDPKAQDHFYGYDLWEGIKNEIGDLIPKGYTLYGEMLGYDKNGAMIQKGFDYGCVPDPTFRSQYPLSHMEAPARHSLEVYRITNTTPDGLVTELSYPEIAEFCEKAGLKPAHLMYYGTAAEWYMRYGITDVDVSNPEHWKLGFIRDLERVYNEKDCFMCNNAVPEEGIAIRKESLFDCETYKLKSFRFLEWETKELDKGESDIESEN